METQDLNKANNRSGHEAHGVHTCHKCGWPFPNPHPSAKHRRAHKRVCGTVQGYNSSSSSLVVDLGVPEQEEKKTTRSNASDEDDELRVSDDGGGNPSSKGRSVSGSKTEEEVLADPVKDLTDGAGAEYFSDGVKEQADLMQKIAEDNTGHTPLPGDNAVADAGNLCLEKSPSGSQLQASQCCRAEEERLEEDKPSHEIFSGSSSTINPVKSEPDAGKAERIVTVDVSQASAITTALYSNEKGSKEQVINKLAAASPGDSSDSPSAGPVLEERGKPEALMDTENLCSPEVESIKDMDMVEDSPQAENNANGKAGSSNKTVEEGLGSSADCVGIPYAPGNVLLKDLPEIMLEDFSDLKKGNTIVAPSLGSFVDVGVVEHHQKHCASQDPESITSAYYLDGNIKRMSEDAISQVGDSVKGKVKMETADAKSTDEAGLKGSVEKTDMESLASDLSGSRSVSSIQEDLDFDKDERTQKVESFKGQKPLLGCDNTLEHNTINTLKEVEAVHGGEDFDNEDSQIHDVLEDEGLKGDEGKLLLRDDMNPEITNDDASDVSETTKLLEGDGVPDTTKNVGREKSSDFVVSSHGKVEDEKNYQHDIVAADMDSTGNYVSKNVESDLQLKNFELQAGVKELGSSKDQNIGGEGNDSADVFATSSLDVGSVDRSHEQKISGSAAASRLSNSNEGEIHMVNTDASSEGVKEQNDSSENVSGGESIVKVDSSLISDYGAGGDPTKKTTDGLVLLEQGNLVSIVQRSASIDKVVIKEMGKEDVSGIIGKCDTTSLKHDEFVSSSDFHADLRSQNDGLEGNRLSVSDASPVTETVSPPSQAWVDAEKPNLHPTAEAEGSDDKSDLAKLTLVDQKERSGLKEFAETIEPLQKPEEKDKNSTGRKKIEEVFSKLTNRSNVKQEHMPLQSLLGEPDQTGAIPYTESKDNSAKTERAILDNQEKPVDEEAAKEEVAKEWNSPARYPANIKREKGKVRSRTYWAPFICCSSIETN